MDPMNHRWESEVLCLPDHQMLIAISIFTGAQAFFYSHLNFVPTLQLKLITVASQHVLSKRKVTYLKESADKVIGELCLGILLCSEVFENVSQLFPVVQCFLLPD